MNDAFTRPITLADIRQATKTKRAKKRQRGADFECLECGKKFRSVSAAERAANNGCPKCGGVDIEIATGGSLYRM